MSVALEYLSAPTPAHEMTGTLYIVSTRSATLRIINAPRAAYPEKVDVIAAETHVIP